ncbi:hypothetical protein Dimus_000420 [Dionaea muscipula]
MLFFSYFKEIVGREVVVELKNDLAIRGTLRSVDQYLNIKLENTRVVDQDKYPHMPATCVPVLLTSPQLKSETLSYLAIGEELFHKRISGQVCSTPT